jgi:hypothetical protein
VRSPEYKQASQKCFAAFASLEAFEREALAQDLASVFATRATQHCQQEPQQLQLVPQQQEQQHQQPSAELLTDAAPQPLTQKQRKSVQKQQQERERKRKQAQRKRQVLQQEQRWCPRYKRKHGDYRQEQQQQQQQDCGAAVAIAVKEEPGLESARKRSRHSFWDE